jgi:hypothetical protein
MRRLERPVLVVNDDDIPKRIDPARLARLPVSNLLMTPPRRLTVMKAIGLHLSWFVYRGTGGVTFEPEQIEPWEDTRNGANSPWAALWFAPVFPQDGRTSTTVTFTKPDEYVLRALADDGALTGFQDVKVVVTP